MARVVKYDGALEKYVRRKFLDGQKRDWAVMSAKDAEWMIMETAIVNREDGMETH